ncbi:MAG: hypothetical protein GXP22_07975 [Gammaproteobacteria bacterium]|nr:hypothetical protein [Gammaproteobacteria bacterium]
MPVQKFNQHWIASFTNATDINPVIIADYLSIRDDTAIKKTHLFDGRYENIYVPLDRIPTLKPVLLQVKHYAAEILNINIEQLKIGFWFNEMQPGHTTTLHRHDDDDELLSCAYYLQVPKQSGQLILEDGKNQQKITPIEGNAIFFSPSLPHAVSENRSDKMRLSIGINIGPNRGQI